MQKNKPLIIASSQSGGSLSAHPLHINMHLPVQCNEETVDTEKHILYYF